MLIHLPRYVPLLSQLLCDLGNPSAAAVAQALDVSPRTVQRWIRNDDAPLVCRLALFHVTTYGRSAVNAQAENDAQIYRMMVQTVQRESAGRTRDLQRMLAVGDFGTANDPLVDLAPLLSPLPAANSGR